MKDATKDVAEDVTQDVVEDVLGAAENGSVKVNHCFFGGAFFTRRVGFRRRSGHVADGHLFALRDGATFTSSSLSTKASSLSSCRSLRFLSSSAAALRGKQCTM